MKIKLYNKLNDLKGKEWMKFTKSWFIHNPKRRDKYKIIHPASFSETLVKDFVTFFTKKNGIVLDPFLGTGSTLIACNDCGRDGIGIEISKKYAKIAKKRVGKFSLKNRKCKIIIGDSRNLNKIWRKYKLPLANFCITSPPYWNQLKRNTHRQKNRKANFLDTRYSNNPKDIGNIDNYKRFLAEQKKIFYEVYRVLKNGSYLVIITNNVFANGKVYPLAFDTAISLSKKWILKDEKIWLQNDKKLLPLGFNSAWVGNRHHQYCLIFRKKNNN